MVVGLRAVIPPNTLRFCFCCFVLPPFTFSLTLPSPSLSRHVFTPHCSALGSRHWADLVKASVFSLGNQPCWKAPV
ncbi:hypothetical protein PR003_g22971 [Phytophthora rubi]|uniref:Uncharacterized protein n=1 Tax=Phytophthora rubi TaxID=129364 RepID=A0A6A4CZD5_9STRA|nr:hypothetical protein PR003_g22971 [Phytophthora rubi]